MSPYPNIVPNALRWLVPLIFGVCLFLGNGLHLHLLPPGHDVPAGELSVALHVHGNPDTVHTSHGDVDLHPGQDDHAHHVATLSLTATTTKTNDDVRPVAGPSGDVTFPDDDAQFTRTRTAPLAKSGPSPPTLIGFIPPTSGRAPPLS